MNSSFFGKFPDRSFTWGLPYLDFPTRGHQPTPTVFNDEQALEVGGKYPHVTR